MSSLTTSGSVIGGGGLPIGRFRLTECSWIGIVMISMTSNTSMTSISGVVLMSIITSRSLPPPPEPTFIAIDRSPEYRCRRPSARDRARRRLGDEGDLRNARPLARVHDAAHAFVLAAPIAANLHLRLRREHGDLLQPLDERIGRLHAQVVPVDAIRRVDRDHDVLRLGLADLVTLLRQLDGNRIAHDRHGDEEDD